MKDNSNPKLLVSKTEASEKIREQINKGNELCKIQISSKQDYANLEHERKKWVDYNQALCQSIFDNSPLYSSHGYGYISFNLNTSLAQDVEALKEVIGDAVNDLESIDQRLGLYEEITPSKEKLRYVKTKVVVKIIKKHLFKFLFGVITSVIGGIILLHIGC